MKLLARLRSRKKKGGSRLFRYGWKVTLLILIAGAGFAVFLFYGTWAQTYDMKNVGEMPERNTVYDVDGKIYSRLAGANRLKVSLSEVSPYFIATVLARVDPRHPQHVCKGGGEQSNNAISAQQSSSRWPQLQPEITGSNGGAAHRT